MVWKKYIINTTVDREDIVCATLNDQGFYSLEIVDEVILPEAIQKEGGYFSELMPDITDTDSAKIIFYVDEDQDISRELGILREQLSQETIEESISDEADWRDKWKQYFHEFSIGDIHICPTWEEPGELCDGQTLIRIDPGIAFGTGKHESTMGCIELMQKYLKPSDRVLDVGFGSGILSVVALKLGASFVVGTDIAPECIDAAADNFAINGIDRAAGTFYIGDLASDGALRKKVGEGCYDIVFANILADIIVSMKDALAYAIRPGGTLICAGIIDFKEEEVKSALSSCGFSVIESRRLGEWTALSAKKDQD